MRTIGLAALILGAGLSVLAPGTNLADDGTTPRLAAPSAQAAAPRVNCTCRFRGEDFQLGSEVCLKGPKGPQLARCATFLNNTSWQFTDTPCPRVSRTGGEGPPVRLAARAR